MLVVEERRPGGQARKTSALMAIGRVARGSSFCRTGTNLWPQAPRPSSRCAALSVTLIDDPEDGAARRFAIEIHPFAIPVIVKVAALHRISGQVRISAPFGPPPVT